ncbi:MAG: hydroxymethylpyrimidine/phosphomethylpyrimidine kinase [Adhaeribacter sp.]
MPRTRPFVLSIAGTDPSGGAGVFADLKTLEANRVNGLGVVSAITSQSDREFFGVDWVPAGQIITQAGAVLKRFPVEVVKIGLIQNLEALLTVLDYLLDGYPERQIIWDPILRASAGFVFHGEPAPPLLGKVLPRLCLLTPNVPEALQLAPSNGPEESARQLSRHCAVLLKGGHRADQPGRDQLFLRSGSQYAYRPQPARVSAKHGSGCVLSAAIAANLALGYPLHRAVLRAKCYTTRFLSSNPSLLGYHL